MNNKQTNNDRDKLFSGLKQTQSIPNSSIQPTQSTDNDSRQQQLLERKQKSTQVLQQCRSELLETRDIGTESLTKMNEQGEKLNKIEKDLRGINENLNTSEYILRGMQGYGSSFLNLFRSPTKEAPINGPTKSPLSKPEPQKPGLLGNLFGKKQEQQTQQQNHYDDPEQDAILDDMSNILKDLQGIGNELNKEIKKQDVVIDRITTQTDRATDRIKKQRVDMTKIS
jgi:hypothetical protein